MPFIDIKEPFADLVWDLGVSIKPCPSGFKFSALEMTACRHMSLLYSFYFTLHETLLLVKMLGGAVLEGVSGWGGGVPRKLKEAGAKTQT